MHTGYIMQTEQAFFRLKSNGSLDLGFFWSLLKAHCHFKISDSMISDLLTLTVALSSDGFVFLQSVVCFWLTGFYLFITCVGLVEFSYILT